MIQLLALEHLPTVVTPGTSLSALSLKYSQELRDGRVGEGCYISTLTRAFVRMTQTDEKKQISKLREAEPKIFSNTPKVKFAKFLTD